tara:strand:- start:235 stop:339 length:105 start_codon:yes stop_codon:yes gene_type:complete
VERGERREEWGAANGNGRRHVRSGERWEERREER